MSVELRPYQIKGIKDIFDAWENCRNILFQMPTGTGKTTLFCDIVRKFKDDFPEKKVLIVTHRRELVQQAAKRLVQDFHLPSGIIAAGQFGDSTEQIQVASIQTLIRREEHKKDVYSLVVIDEAHHAKAQTYQKLWEIFPSAKFLGVTATPIRTNGEGFDDLFSELITSDSIKTFIKNGHLSDFRYFANHTPDVSRVKIRTTGDYDETELSELMQNDGVMADLIQSYKEFANGEKMIVYAVNKAHSKKIVERYNGLNISAMYIDDSTLPNERLQIVEDFKKSKFKVLCNVNIFTEGFDCPDVVCVQLARPTKSLTLYLQQVGRCMRPHKNKEYAIILDNAGVWKEHGLPKWDRKWSLEGKGIDDTANQSIIGLKQYPNDENNEPKESKSLRLVEIGELEEIYPEERTPNDIVNFIDIDKLLIDNNIKTMSEEINNLIEDIAQLQKNYEEGGFNPRNKAELQRIIEEKTNKLHSLQSGYQPKRFEQLLELIVEKCQETIANNDILIEGDKDKFLRQFVEPTLKNEDIKLVNSFPIRIVQKKRTLNKVKTIQLTILEILINSDGHSPIKILHHKIIEKCKEIFINSDEKQIYKSIAAAKHLLKNENLIRDLAPRSWEITEKGEKFYNKEQEIVLSTLNGDVTKNNIYRKDLILENGKSRNKIKRYKLAILEILIESGGNTSSKIVKKKISEKFIGEFTKSDYEKHKSGTPLWKHTIDAAKAVLKEDSLIRDIARGIWAITENGREFYNKESLLPTSGETVPDSQNEYVTEEDFSYLGKRRFAYTLNGSITVNVNGTEKELENQLAEKGLKADVPKLYIELNETADLLAKHFAEG